MKILFIGSRVPWPMHDGGAIATYQLLRGLHDAGNEVTFFTFNTRKHFAGQEILDKYFSFCRVITTPLNATPSALGAFKHLIKGLNYNIERFNDADAIEKLKQLLAEETFDLIHFDGLYSTPLLPATDGIKTVKVLRQHNAEFRIWEKLAAAEKGFVKKWYFSRLAKQLKKYESRILARFNAVVPITADDEALFKKLNDKPEYHVCEVGVSVKEIDFNIEPMKFFHIGSMEWMPNRQGVSWLVNEVWPLVLEKLPEATLHLAGKGLKSDDELFEAEGVINHGEVESALDFMTNHGIMCIPLFSGGGIRVKLLEAMALGIPVVATPIASAGTIFLDGKELFIADKAEIFAERMILLSQNPDARKAMSNNGKMQVNIHYSAAPIVHQLNVFYQKLLSAHV